MSKSESDKGFKILLLVLGFLFGLSGSYIMQRLDIKERKASIASFLRSTVEQDLAKNESAINIFQAIIDTVKKPLMIKENFSWFHNNDIVMNSISSNIYLLEPEITFKFVGYCVMYEQCKSEIRLIMNSLDSTNKYSQIDKELLHGYIISLKNFSKTGNKLLEDIHKFYP